MREWRNWLAAPDSKSGARKGVWDRMTREHKHKTNNVLAIIREALAYRGDVTDEMVTSYFENITNSLPYNGPMA